MNGSKRVQELTAAVHRYADEINNDGNPQWYPCQQLADAIARDLDTPIRWRPIEECDVYRALVTNGQCVMVASRSDSGAWWPDGAKYPVTATHFCPIVLPAPPDSKGGGV